MDGLILTTTQKEQLFTTLMMISIEAQKDGSPFPSDSPVEDWLTWLEWDSGMDGKMFRAHGRYFHLEDMTEHEHRVFRLLVEKGCITP